MTSAALVDETYLNCQLYDCDQQASVIVVTINEGFCFERCTQHAERSLLWPPRERRRSVLVEVQPNSR